MGKACCSELQGNILQIVNPQTVKQFPQQSPGVLTFQSIVTEILYLATHT